tara:strand:- start:879 stop:1076 length:198 start_codon:yes stop_codon:yes gene_type:complete
MDMVGPPTYPAPIQQIFMLNLVIISNYSDKVIPEEEKARFTSNDGILFFLVALQRVKTVCDRQNA